MTYEKISTIKISLSEEEVKLISEALCLLSDLDEDAKYGGLEKNPFANSAEALDNLMDLIENNVITYYEEGF